MTAPAFTVAETIAQALSRHGVEVIFAQSLPSAVILAAEARGIHQIAYRQENMGGAMADGYARKSGRIPVVAAQNGPAATLLVPPLAEALKASVPIVALVQEVERPQLDRNAFQELDHLALFQSCAKWVRRIITADRADDYVDAAFVAAGSGRPGPAVLLLPADLLREPAVAPAFTRHSRYAEWPIDRFRPSDALIDEAAGLIANARAPIILAGGGVLSSGAAPVLACLQEDIHLPVLTTVMGKGAVDERHALSAGVLGPLTAERSLGRHTRTLLAEADLVLLLGTRTNQNGTDSWRSIPAAARIIHADVDPNEIGRNYDALRLVGDLRETLRALHGALLRLDRSVRREKRNEVAGRIADAWAAFSRERAPFAQSDTSPMRPERIMHELDKCLTADTTVVADASYASMWIAGELTGRAPGTRFLSPRGLAGLGWGLPLAIGARIAAPSQPVVAVVGDGGFAHSWAEIETLVRHHIAVTVIVLNNGVLGFQKDAETVKFGRYTSACHFADVDHAAIAKACGCSSVRIETPEALYPAIHTAIASGLPWLIDVVTDPAAFPPLSLFERSGIGRSSPPP
jgi:acetolactate synthase I/II/III large subunit